MSTARVILAEDNREYFIEKFAEYLVWINESLELTLKEYIRQNEPKMRKPTWFGFGKAFWTHESPPEPGDVDIYWKTISDFHWHDSKYYKSLHAEYYHKYETVMIALMNGDTVDISAEMFDQVVRKADPKSWLREI